MRYVISGIAGLMAAGLIFLFMNHLVGDSAVATVEPEPVSPVTILAETIDDPPQQKPYDTPEPPEKPREPAPAPTDRSVPTEPVEQPVHEPAPGPGDGPAIPAGPLVEGPVDGEPGVKTGIQPRYPRHAAQQGIEGWVRVSFTIDASGRPVDVRVLDAAPRGHFERAAKRAVYKSRYYPAREGGQPVAVRVTQTIRFAMDSRKGD